MELTEAPPCDWPTYRDVAEDTELDRKVVGDALGSVRGRWKRRPDLTTVRGDLVDLLARRGGIVAADELAGILLTARGSLASQPIRSQRARAVVRAAAETEATLQETRFLVRRLGAAFLLALDGEVPIQGETMAWDAERLTDAAAALGEVAEELAHRQPLPSPEQVVRELRQVELPEGVGPLTDPRLVRLAASASETGSVSTRLELYPLGMDADRALQESRSVLLDRRGLDVAEVQNRVRARFPEAAAIPGRPELDGLLKPLGLKWEEGRYGLPAHGGLLSTFMSSATRTTIFATPDDKAAAVRELDGRLRAITESGGFLALTVGRRRYAQAGEVVAQRIGANRIDLDRLLLEAMHAKCDELGARWDAFLDADNRRGEQAWTRLGQLLDQTMPAVETELLGQHGVVVLTGLGLLARYDRSTLLERLRDALTRGATDSSLRGLILVVPGEDPSARPVVDGMPIPVITANQWAHVPSAWLIEQAEGDTA